MDSGLVQADVGEVFTHVLGGVDEIAESIQVGARNGSDEETVENGDQLLYLRQRQPRTYISVEQREVLEDLFQNGMTSVSARVIPLMEQAASETKLELNIIKNWIRNRQRKERHIKEREAEKAEAQNVSVNAPEITVSNDVMLPPIVVPSYESPPGNHVMVTASNTGKIILTPSNTSQQVGEELGPPNPKKHNPGTPVMVPQLITHSKSPTTITLVKPEPAKKLVPKSNKHLNPLTVKVRVFDSGEMDFVEVDLNAMSYDGLVKSVCQELSIKPSKIQKIRKLPNVLIRKDKDVLRLVEGQELEVVLKQL